MPVISQESALSRYPLLRDEVRSSVPFRMFRVPTDVTIKYRVAELAELLVPKRTTACLLMTERGIWPNSEVPFITDTLLNLWSGTTTDGGCVAMEFASSEMDCLKAFSFLCQANIWGYRIATPRMGICLEFDHDEFLQVYAREPSERLTTILKAIRHTGLKQIKPGTWDEVIEEEF